VCEGVAAHRYTSAITGAAVGAPGVQYHVQPQEAGRPELQGRAAPIGPSSRSIATATRALAMPRDREVEWERCAHPVERPRSARGGCGAHTTEIGGLVQARQEQVLRQRSRALLRSHGVRGPCRPTYLRRMADAAVAAYHRRTQLTSCTPNGHRTKSGVDDPRSDGERGVAERAGLRLAARCTRCP